MFQAFLDASYSFQFTKYFNIQLARLPMQIMVAYFNLYFLLPRFLLEKKYAIYLSLLFLTMVLAGIFQRMVVVFLILPFYPEYCTTHLWEWHVILYDIVSLYPIVALTLALKFLRDWYKNQQKTQVLEKEKLNAELKFLKSQIHPHFFFNTLNNLYALTLMKSNDAPGVVLKLSDLMDYLLYESNASTVSLAREIEHMKNYVALEKLRFGDRLDMKFEVTGEIEGKKISPLLILPFLENTFKHGVNTSINQSWVNILFEIRKETLFLLVENSKSSKNLKTPEEMEKTCIGLTNVKRRLELLYPQHYQIRIEDKPDKFIVRLELDLSHNLIQYDIPVDHPSPHE